MGVYHTASDDETKGCDQGTRILVEEDVHERGLLPTGALAPCLDSSLTNLQHAARPLPEEMKGILQTPTVPHAGQSGLSLHQAVAG